MIITTSLFNRPPPSAKRYSAYKAKHLFARLEGGCVGPHRFDGAGQVALQYSRKRGSKRGQRPAADAGIGQIYAGGPHPDQHLVGGHLQSGQFDGLKRTCTRPEYYRATGTTMKLSLDQLISSGLPASAIVSSLTSLPEP